MPRRLRSALPDLPPRDEPKRLVAFDLSTRRARDIYEVTIYDPAELGAKVDTGIRIGIRSVFSHQAKAAARAAAERRPVRAEDGSINAADEGAISSNLVEQTIGVTVYWKHVDDPEFADALNVRGEKVPCTPETVRELYTSPETAWIQKQVEEEYIDITNFFDKPKPASPPAPSTASG